MKKFMMFAMFVFVCSCSWGAEKAELVTQPAYHSMSFYVHKPVNVPRDFYVTFDGYLVYKNERGVWHYGSAESNGILKTGYVVGSVIPSVVRLKPYNAQISSVAPILNTPQAETRPADNVRVYEPPASPFDSVTRSQGLGVPPTFAPPGDSQNELHVWTRDSNFTAIGRWKKSVDRIGVTSRPAMPVAWKGNYPEAVYVWTGVRWRQVDARGKHITAESTLRRELYALTVELNKTNAPIWTDNDSRVLAEYADTWGYRWMGLVILGRSY